PHGTHELNSDYGLVRTWEESDVRH
ncbi:MAG: hypothetical protein RI954_38, partial [Actinomycetota bacterium]